MRIPTENNELMAYSTKQKNEIGIEETPLLAQLSYWKQQLAGAPPVLELPTDRPRPPVQTFRFAMRSQELPQTLTESLLVLSQKEGVSLFMTLLTAFKTLLYRYTGQEDILIGSPIPNPNSNKTEELSSFKANTLVLRTQLQGNPSFLELLGRVREMVWEAYAHQDLPFEKLVEELQPERSLSYSPLFQVMFALQNAQLEKLELPSLTITPLQQESLTSKFDLVLSMEETDRGLLGSWEYSTDLFDAVTINRMAGHFQTLLEEIVAHPELPISELPLLSEAERHQQLVKWNDTQTEYPQDKCIHQLFEEQVELTPDAVALVYQNEQLTYRELNTRANQLAHHLQSLGVGPEVLVGICVERSLEMVVGLLAILKAGGAYVPLDPTYPQERLAYMLSDSQVSVLLTQEKLVADLPEQTAHMVCLDEVWEQIAQNYQDNPISGVRVFHLAYVIYTSGSTGRPKGVMVTHTGLCNLAQAQIQTFDLHPESRILQFASLSFDASISEVVMALRSGTTLYLGTKDSLLPGMPLIQLLRDYCITHVTLPPSALAVLPVEELPTLQTMIVAGEACSPELITKWSAGRNFFNAYGPTETTVCATVAKCTDSDKKAPIGRPIANTQVYILDSNLQPVPIGVPGELHIGGAGLARGYLNARELTQEKFIPNPFSTHLHSRLYKTGDLARYLPDGNIEYLGRIDRQVKIRGYRIDPGEIEAVLVQNPNVQEAVVIDREDHPGNKRLVAYVVPQQGRLNPLQEQDNQQTGQIELWPSVAEYYVYDDLLYYAMTNDERRNHSYKVAINQLVKDKVVVEIGTGKDAILARLCAEAGARKVYAIERDEETCRLANAGIQKLGLSDRIFVIHGDATLVNLPELADVCVSEIVGPIGGCEGAAVIINDARKFLKQDGAMIPKRSITKIAPACLPDEILENPQFTKVSSHYTEKIFEQVGYPFDLRVCIKKFPKSNLLSNADVFEDLDFAKPVSTEFRHKVNFTIDKDGRLDGFLVWLNLQTIEGEVIDILEYEYCWLPVYFPVFHPGIEVSAGDIIQAVCTRALCENNLNPDYAIKGRLLRKNSEVIEFEHISYHYKNLFKQTPFYQRLFADDNIGSHPDNLAQALRGYLKEILPEYMMPSAIVMLESLPLTPNGKVNRKALPAPNTIRPDLEETFVSPRTPVEEVLAGIWFEVLRLQQIGVHDNFFNLGGHSLATTQIMSRVRDVFQVELPFHSFFENPTIANLAKIIEQDSRGNQQLRFPPIQPISRNGNLPVSFAQEGVCFIQQLAPKNTAYQAQGTIRFTGELDVKALQDSLCEIVRRHEIFRTTFPTVDGQPVQVIHPPQPINLPLVDLHTLPEDERSTEVQRLLNAEFQKPFDPAQLPLVRWVLLRLGDREHLLIQVEYHLVHDGWSFNVFLRELVELYKFFVVGKPSPLPELPIQFADFAHWQRQWMQGKEAEIQLAYWKKKLANSLPLLELPYDRPRPAEQTYRGAAQRIELPISLCKSLQALSRQEGTTLFMTMLAAFVTMLHRYTQQEDINVGSSIANRRLRETEGLIGMFVNTFVLRNDISGNPTFCDLLNRVRQVTLEAYAHQDLPFGKVVEALQPTRNLSHNPLYQVMFSFHDAPLPDLEISGLNVSQQEALSNGSAKLDLDLVVIPRSQGSSFGKKAEGMTLVCEYSTDLFDATTIQRMIRHYQTLLESIVANPEQRISELPLLTVSERHQLLEEWNDTQTQYPQDQCIHQLFEAQVEQTPNAVALMFENQQLTYWELNCRANQLADYLQTLGVGPEVLVGLCVERSIEMVIAILAILKSGGAYVPLDPGYPTERLAYMLNDSQVSVLLTQQKLVNLLPEHQAQLVCLDTNSKRISTASQKNPISEVKPQHLAYVIYTSGSTGQPKGVMIQHQSLVNFTEAVKAEYQLCQSDRVLQFASISFDAAAEEIYPCLSSGGMLVLRTNEMLNSVPQFLQRCWDLQLTVLDLPTAYWHLIVSELANTNLALPESLRLVIIGGERAIPEQVAIWQQYVGSVPKLVNTYGPTEATIVTTLCQLSDSTSAKLNGQEVPIGRPIRNAQVYVLDRYLQPVSIGVPGELYIGGAPLARGYINHPQLTQEKFIPNPYSQEEGARLYKTGDLVRYLPDGNLEYLGRIDNQVKIRGFRIELGEIEAVVSQHQKVKQAIVIAREDYVGDRRLVAYIVPHQEQAPTLDELRRFLKQKLPAYMMPNAFAILESLPLSPNGKIDYRALPAPNQLQPEPGRNFVPPRTPVEQHLVDIWNQVLKVEAGIHDNFFELGGHSLLATQVISRLRQAFSVELPLHSLFKFPTVAELAEYLETLRWITLAQQTPAFTTGDIREQGEI